MSFQLTHTLIAETLYPGAQLQTHETPQTADTPPQTWFTISAEGYFDVLHPGKLLREGVRASVTVTTVSQPLDNPNDPRDPSYDPDNPGGLGGGPGGSGGGIAKQTGQTQTKVNQTAISRGTRIASPEFNDTLEPAQPDVIAKKDGVNVAEEGFQYFEFRLYDPNGNLFTRDEITLEDLKKFRDLRGTPLGHWRYTLVGKSRLFPAIFTPALKLYADNPKGTINLNLLETIPSTSAPPLVPSTQLSGSGLNKSFDLYRAGEFVAHITSVPAAPWKGSMALIDPNGKKIASSTALELRCPITPQMLGASRDAASKPRLWTLQVSPQGGVVVGPRFVSATVYGEGRIGAQALQERIQTMIGPNGQFLKLHGENSGGQARLMLTVTDLVAAETLDMHGLLDSQLEKEGQSKDIKAGKPMVLYSHDADFGYGLSLDVSTVKLWVDSIEIGPGGANGLISTFGLGAQTPVVRLSVKMEGELKLKFLGGTVGSAKLGGGGATMEIGIKIDADGMPRIVQWLPGGILDLDVSKAIGIGLPLVWGAVEIAEEFINNYIPNKAKELFTKDPSLAPRILMTIFGTHLTYLPPRFEGNDILFEHIAPLEPESKPRGKDGAVNYTGAIGRTPLMESVLGPRFLQSLGDTWKADNLKSKIEHIVVVMMENRSYDHVLGYRAQAANGGDGLSAEMMAAINAAAQPPEVFDDSIPHPPSLPPVHKLSEAAFAPNSLKKKTAIPKDVGHAMKDVREQLAAKVDGPDGRKINDPKCFMENFRVKELHGKPLEDGCTPFTVLGYYDNEDLPIMDFFAKNYAYCDKYFCSHPGPTLPNRMYTLTGDVQYDRLGVPILENNSGDNFLLSRAPTIFDLLSRKGVSWRVYESNPSVAMLRMFARYATDKEHIRNLYPNPKNPAINQLALDVAKGDLPALTMVEPRMHSYPEDDDHPPADMYRGQHFLRNVYQALRANPAIWSKTLLIVTYDEHGGLYDHVIPPLADMLNPILKLESDVNSTTGGTTGGATSGGASTVGGTKALKAAANLGNIATATSTTATSTTAGATKTVDLKANVQFPTEVKDWSTQAAQEPLPVDAPVMINYGVRVPTFAVSPWVVPGTVSSVILDHCSILKTVLARFCGDEKPFLSDRVQVSHSFESLLSSPTPNMNTDEPPPLNPFPEDAQLTNFTRLRVSSASEIITPPLSRKQMREGNVDYHDISGRLARMLGR